MRLAIATRLLYTIKESLQISTFDLSKGHLPRDTAIVAFYINTDLIFEFHAGVNHGHSGRNLRTQDGPNGRETEVVLDRISFETVYRYRQVQAFSLEPLSYSRAFRIAINQSDHVVALR